MRIRQAAKVNPAPAPFISRLMLRPGSDPAADALRLDGSFHNSTSDGAFLARLRSGGAKTGEPSFALDQRPTGSSIKIWGRWPSVYPDSYRQTIERLAPAWQAAVAELFEVYRAKYMHRARLAGLPYLLREVQVSSGPLSNPPNPLAKVGASGSIRLMGLPGSGLRHFSLSATAGDRAKQFKLYRPGFGRYPAYQPTREAVFGLDPAATAIVRAAALIEADPGGLATPRAIGIMDGLLELGGPTLALFDELAALFERENRNA